MSDEEYRGLLIGDNAGNIITHRVERDLIEGGHYWTVRHNGVVTAQGWTAKGRGAASDLARARVRHFIETGAWQ